MIMSSAFILVIVQVTVALQVKNKVHLASVRHEDESIAYDLFQHIFKRDCNELTCDIVVERNNKCHLTKLSYGIDEQKQSVTFAEASFVIRRVSKTSRLDFQIQFSSYNPTIRAMTACDHSATFAVENVSKLINHVTLLVKSSSGSVSLLNPNNFADSRLITKCSSVTEYGAVGFFCFMSKRKSIVLFRIYKRDSKITEKQILRLSSNDVKLLRFDSLTRFLYWYESNLFYRAILDFTFKIASQSVIPSPKAGIDDIKETKCDIEGNCYNLLSNGSIFGIIDGFAVASHCTARHFFFGFAADEKQIFVLPSCQPVAVKLRNVSNVFRLFGNLIILNDTHHAEMSPDGRLLKFDLISKNFVFNAVRNDEVRVLESIDRSKWFCKNCIDVRLSEENDKLQLSSHSIFSLHIKINARFSSDCSTCGTFNDPVFLVAGEGKNLSIPFVIPFTEAFKLTIHLTNDLIRFDASLELNFAPKVNYGRTIGKRAAAIQQYSVIKDEFDLRLKSSHPDQMSFTWLNAASAFPTANFSLQWRKSNSSNMPWVQKTVPAAAERVTLTGFESSDRFDFKIHLHISDESYQVAQLWGVRTLNFGTIEVGRVGYYDAELKYNNAKKLDGHLSLHYKEANENDSFVVPRMLKSDTVVPLIDLKPNTTYEYFFIFIPSSNNWSHHIEWPLKHDTFHTKGTNAPSVDRIRRDFHSNRYTLKLALMDIESNLYSVRVRSCDDCENCTFYDEEIFPIDSDDKTLQMTTNHSAFYLQIFNDEFVSDISECVIALDAAMVSFNDNLIGKVLPIVSVLIIFSLFLVLIVCCCYKLRQPSLRKQLSLLKQSNSKILNEINEMYDAYETNGDLTRINTIASKSIRVLRLVGSGAFGDVYEALLLEKQTVAVKVLRDTTQQESFMREAFLMSLFKHDNVVSFLALCPSPTFIVTEYMPKGDLLTCLRDLRKKSPPIETQILIQAICQIAEGCRYLEKMQFIHRDLAARNCLVSSDLVSKNFKIKIADFGLARNNLYYKKGFQNLLPVRWMPPESLIDGIFSRHSDVWLGWKLDLGGSGGVLNLDVNQPVISPFRSFGVVCWEVLSLGQQPYAGKTNNEVIKFVQNYGILEKPSHSSNLMYDLMQSCWTFSASQRPSFDKILTIIQQIPTDSEQAGCGTADVDDYQCITKTRF